MARWHPEHPVGDDIDVPAATMVRARGFYAHLVAIPAHRRSVVALVALAVAGGCGQSGTTRQAEVAERGAEVMPFDLDATTHRFEPTANGLAQTVVADNPDDERQVVLIREHLEAKHRRFERGDFSDPAHIHGTDMPGLAYLQARATDVDISYIEVAAGGRLLFVSDDADLIAALHEWGRAQTADHGSHADHSDS